MKVIRMRWMIIVENVNKCYIVIVILGYYSISNVDVSMYIDNLDPDNNVFMTKCLFCTTL